MKEKATEKKLLPIHPVCAVLIALGLIGGGVHLFSTLYPEFADFINSTAGSFLRLILAKISDVYPLSIMEHLLFASPAIIAVCGVFIYKYARRGRIYVIRAVCAVLSVAAGVYFCFGVGFAPGYHGSTLAKKIGLTDREVTAEELYEVSLIVINEVNALSGEIDYGKDGASTTPFSLRELSDELSDCYKDLEKEHGFLNTFSSDVKPLLISPLMTYTHISGIYSFFTGEANLNTNYPDYVNVFSAAHEMAHQRGISREDEANFTAFLVLSESDVPYLRYCAYLSMYEYLSSALYSADAELYFKAADMLSPEANGELIAFSLFFEKYQDNTASQVSDSINNSYLLNQGTEGTESYGMVVDLAVSYYLD